MWKELVYGKVRWILYIVIDDMQPFLHMCLSFFSSPLPFLSSHLAHCFSPILTVPLLFFPFTYAYTSWVSVRHDKIRVC